MDAKQLHPLVTTLFAQARTRTTRVAVEQELLVAETAAATGIGGSVAIERVRRAARGTVAAQYLGFEPGGQIELSLPCFPDAASLVRDLRNVTDELDQHLAADGIRTYALPVDPRPEHEVPLQLTTPRYVAMHRHFDAIGPAGRRMMRRTASTQICLDWWPGRAGAEQWRVLNLMRPVPRRRLRPKRRPRGQAQHLARPRSGPRRIRRPPPVRRRPRRGVHILRNGATVFVTGGAADHLTTLFPPVRPRGTYLEVRFLDVQEADTIGRLVATLTDLLYDDVRRRRTLRALEPTRHQLAENWRAAAAGCPTTAARGFELIPDLERVA